MDTKTETPPEMPYNRLRTALLLYGKPPAELAPQELERVLAQAEREHRIERLVLESPEAVGVVVGADELERAYAEVRGKYPDEAAFQAGLEAGGLDGDALRLALARQCKVNTVLDRVAAARPAEVGELEVGIYYHEHFRQFQQPERRDAYHILISVNEDFPDNARPRALERIRALADALAAKPHRFEELAGRHSECPTALRGGRIGRVRRGQLYPSLDEALFRLRPGQLSGVVESEMGFHILLCRRVDPPQTLSLKKAAPHIRKILAERVRESRRREWLAGLASKPNGRTPP